MSGTIHDGVWEAGVDDAESLGDWLCDHAAGKARDPVELAADAEARCRSLRIEPPTPDRIARIVRAAVHAYEDKRIAAVHARLTSAMRVGLDALLQSAGADGAAEAEYMATPDGRVDAPLIHLRAGPGLASVASLRDELARLDTVRGLPPRVTWPRGSGEYAVQCRAGRLEQAGPAVVGGPGR